MKLNIKSFFSKKYTKFWIIFLIVIVVSIPVILIPITLTLNKRDFVLANYKSYMNPATEKVLKDRYGLSFDAFENAEDAKKLIKQNAADIVNTTSYELVEWINEGIVHKLDWSQFNISGINNANDALKLFTSPVVDILTGYDLNNNNKFYPEDKEDNLLNYGVPYFLQDLVFCYRGNKINQLSSSSSWDTIFKVLASVANFNNSNRPPIAALNDPRTIYSIARLMQTNNKQVNPNPNDNSAESLTTTYNFLSAALNKIKNKPITFSDSNSVLNQLASNDVKAAIMFNGDAIYSSFGGDQGYEINDFYYVKPLNTLAALDLFTINKNINQEKLDKAYQVLNDLSLRFDINHPEANISFQNFDYVNYTTPLKSMYDYLTNPNTDYFNNVQLSLFKINNAKQYELPINNITKSNFSFAWINFKSNL